MGSVKNDEKADESEAELNRALREVMENLPDIPTQLRCRRRERVGKAFVLMAPFCLFVAALPWRGFNWIDQLMWVGFALCLLVLGGWQIDKASTDEERASRMLGHAQQKTSSTGGLIKTIRRVK